MPTISKPRKAVQIGDSKYLLLSSDYHRAIQQMTDEDYPKFRTIGDTIVVVVPEGIGVKKTHLTELLKQIAKIPITDKSKIEKSKKE